MSTSGQTAFLLTARDYITRALRSAKIVAKGEDPSADEMEDGRTVLNSWIKSLQTEGVTWGLSRGTVTLAADAGSGTLPPEVRLIETAYVVQGDRERPLGALTRAEYLSYPNKTSRGVPSGYYLDRQRDASVLYVWPVPTIETQISIDYARCLEVVTDVSETIDIPEEWAETVWRNIAVLFNEEFSDRPLSDVYISRANMLMSKLLDSSRPDSYFLGAYDYA